MKVREVLAAGLGLSVAGWTAPAGAQPSSAQAQFDYGLSEMLAGRYATGCPALAASQSSDPRPGTLFTLGECELRWGHSASALRHLVAYLDGVVKMPSESDRQLQADRVKLATAQRASLERVVGHVVVELPSSAPPDALVRVDGEVIAKTALAAPLAVDPGSHVLELALGDGRTTRQSLTIEKGEQRRVALALPAAAASAAVPPPEPTPPADASAPASTSGARTGMWIAGGVGAAGVVLGGVAGLVAVMQKSTASSSCGTGGLDPGQCTSQQGVDAGNASRTWANVSTVSFGVGAAAAATALVLWLVSPSPGGAANGWQPALGVGPGSPWIGAARVW